MENNSVPSVKDLSITNLRSLSRTSHIVEAVNKANKFLGLIKRTVSSAEKSIFFTLYKSLVRQILEYASPVSSPFLVRHCPFRKSPEKDIAVGLRSAKGQNAFPRSL